MAVPRTAISAALADRVRPCGVSSASGWAMVPSGFTGAALRRPVIYVGNFGDGARRDDFVKKDFGVELCLPSFVHIFHKLYNLPPK